MSKRSGGSNDDRDERGRYRDELLARIYDLEAHAERTVRCQRTREERP